MKRGPGGLSLVELMIALALGSVLCLAVTTLLAYAQRAYLQDEELARLQENGRHALRLLQREIAMAGYLGRLQPAEISSPAVSGAGCFAYLLAVEPGLEHFDDIGSDGLSASGAAIPEACLRPGQYQAGSDALVVRRTLDQPHRDFGEVLVPLSATTHYLQAHGRSGLVVPGGEVDSGATSVWQYHPQQFFVRSYSRLPGDGIPSLCRQRLSPNRADLAPLECLVEGVEMLQVEFAVDTDGDRRADRHLPAPGATGVSRVLLAQIYLLMRSHREVAGHRDNRDYRLGQTLYRAPGDGFYRQLFSASVLVRNSDAYRS